MSDDALRRIDALLEVGLHLARSAPTGTIALARLARSIDPAWLPRPDADAIIAELDAARAAASEPIAFAQVERTLHHAWDGAPTDELDELDRDPVAVTPIAQVHRGLLDGSPVAVKVLRPGLAAAVRQDLVLLEGLFPPLGAAFPGLNARALLHEVRERVLDELDLEQEAVAQRRFYRALRNHPALMVPAPVMRLAHDSVLVSEWVDGVPLTQAPDPDRAGAQLVVFAIGAARSGIVHADLGPDDALVLADGRLAILDFGATGTVDPGRVGIAAALVEAFIGADDDALADALTELGWLAPAPARTAAALARHTLAEFGAPEPVRLDADAVIAAADRLLAQPAAVSELLRAGALPPEDLWAVRGLAQLVGTIARVDATAPWRELARAALRDGWNASLS
ncbi:MAG TPA: AarF/ABC1/UbiB kinase family protein [Solirubrobacteraceae bacterium]|nr:AarF/ABC1/UbiB kinase family protein [Solirubrobacteraceae bacterium]